MSSYNSIFISLATYFQLQEETSTSLKNGHGVHINERLLKIFQ